MTSTLVSPPDGILVVDKPRGHSSHDVVSWARRALGTKAVGHAGTLDPMATGVLVLGVGEGTKLTSYLMSEDKEYETTIALGAETDSLDADGQVVAEADVPALDRARVEGAARAFVGTYTQRAPVVSAIKRDGVALYERVRRGEEVEAPERIVRCDGIEILDVREREIDLRVRCGKGFYVRSLGRDLARALGTVGHLGALRRSRSGAFAASAALSGEVLRAARTDETLRPQVREALRSLVDAVGTMPRIEIDAAGVRELRCGRPLPRPRPAEADAIAALGPGPELVAITRWQDGKLRVVRGFGGRTSQGAIG